MKNHKKQIEYKINRRTELYQQNAQTMSKENLEKRFVELQISQDKHEEEKITLKNKILKLEQKIIKKNK